MLHPLIGSGATSRSDVDLQRKNLHFLFFKHGNNSSTAFLIPSSSKSLSKQVDFFKLACNFSTLMIKRYICVNQQKISARQCYTVHDLDTYILGIFVV